MVEIVTNSSDDAAGALQGDPANIEVVKQSMSQLPCHHIEIWSTTKDVASDRKVHVCQMLQTHCQAAHYLADMFCTEMYDS